MQFSGIVEKSLREKFALPSKKCICIHSKNCQICSATKPVSLTDTFEMIGIYKQVKHLGKYNFEGCRIPINSKINTDFMRNLLFDCKDKVVCDLLEFGFPLSFKGNVKNFPQLEVWKYKNHREATEFPEDMIKYLHKESDHKAILGPFKANPFSDNIVISPLNSVPEKAPSERRIILDLRYPKSQSVNDMKAFVKMNIWGIS